MARSILLDKSLRLAKEAIDIYKFCANRHEYVLADQFLKSATSIGANLREGRFAESKKDFVHKFNIALKECNETLYWLELIRYSGYENINDINGITRECNDILRMILSSIRTCERNMNESE